jgi:hypothetical protein
MTSLEVWQALVGIRVLDVSGLIRRGFMPMDLEG